MAGSDEKHYSVIILGGGIAGVSCAQALSQGDPDLDVLLLSASPIIKAVTNFRQVTKRLEEFDVVERPMFELNAACPNVTVLQKVVASLDLANKSITTADKTTFTYKKLCICTGGVPKLIAENSPYVLGIRDTETVKVFQHQLQNARRIVIVGNGGIATELVYEIEGCEVVWAIKDKSISSTFIDAGAAEFFLPMLRSAKQEPQKRKRTKYVVEDQTDEGKSSDVPLGGALGPDWHEKVHLKGSKEVSHAIHIEKEVEVVRLYTPQELKESQKKAETLGDQGCPQDSDWPVYIELTNGKIYGCDFVVSATGVVPNTQPFAGQIALAEDGGINVDDQMRTSKSDIYAAGDVCTAAWDWADFWQQMRLWSQARQMGCYAARCMLAHLNSEDVMMDFCFEMFAHVTKFYNFKVILLGKYNAQGMGDDYNILLRVTKGEEYVKTVMRDGRMYGAILIGETDLEETFENLILNQMDLSVYGEDLLDPNIDIEDYFD